MIKKVLITTLLSLSWYHVSFAMIQNPFESNRYQTLKDTLQSRSPFSLSPAELGDCFNLLKWAIDHNQMNHGNEVLGYIHKHLDVRDVTIVNRAKLMEVWKLAKNSLCYDLYRALTLIVSPVLEGHVGVLKDLVPKLPNINALHPVVKTTILHDAITTGDVALVKLICDQKGVDVCARDLKKAATPLHCAAQLANADMLKLLVPLISNINPVDLDDCTPLHYAVRAGSVECVKFLCDQKGIKINSYDRYDAPPLLYAIKLASENVTISIDSIEKLIEILIEAGADINATIIKKTQTAEEKITRAMSLVHEAISTKQSFIIKKLLTYDALNVNAVGVCTAYDKHTNELKQEIKKTPLAVLLGLETATNIAEERVEIAEMIVQVLQHPLIAGPQTIDGQTPLHIAVERNDELVVKNLLRRKNIDVNAGDDEQQTPLHIAAGIGNSNIVEALLAYPMIAPGSADNNGNTPLHVAAVNGDLLIVQALLRHGATVVNIFNKSGVNALGIALEVFESQPENSDNFPAVIALLLRAGAQVMYDSEIDILKNIFPEDFVNVLIDADPVRLLQNIIALDTTDDYGATLLMYIAGYQGNVDAVRFLLEHGANPLRRDKNGNSASSLVHTILQQMRYLITITPNLDVQANAANEIRQYEAIAAELLAASINDVVSLPDKAKVGDKRKLEEVAEPVAKKAKHENSPKIPLVDLSDEDNQEKTFLDELPTDLLRTIFLYALISKK